jgi:hypothetical protein
VAPQKYRRAACSPLKFTLRFRSCAASLPLLPRHLSAANVRVASRCARSTRSPASPRLP